MDSGYPVEDSQYNAYSRLAGPAYHSDGVTFWYSGNNEEPVYQDDPNVSGRWVGLPGHNAVSSNTKHRRTRSGCYTCRSRRVKCDESRPICERCKKGDRQCEFPQPSSSSKQSKQAEVLSPHEPTRKDSTSQTLPPVPDESESEEKSTGPTFRPTTAGSRANSYQFQSRKHKFRASQDVAATFRDKASPQSFTSSSSQSRTETPASSLPVSALAADLLARHAKIKVLPPSVQKYLFFQLEHMTHYFYLYKIDPTDFLHNEFVDQALSFEPLLYAVVGFAAYHYELRQSSPHLSHFLKYHSKALVLLRKAIAKTETYTPAMLLTVLQLATVEEYMGDWVNLIGHHRAAFTMLTSLYTPATMTETDLGRCIFSWYARLDVIAGMMAGSTTRLDRSWFEADASWHAGAVDDDPENDVDIEGMLASAFATNRLLGFDMATLFAQMSGGKLSIADFTAENNKIVERLASVKREIERMNDSFYSVTHYPRAEIQPYDPEFDIVDPYTPGGLFKDALFNLNFMWIDWYAIEQMQKYQTSIILQHPPPEDLALISLHQCRIYESIDRFPDAPEGAILGAHASLGLATVFLKKDAKHTMWARRRLANIERLGYVFPERFRAQMAQLWGLSREQVGEQDSVEDWWLPGGEGKLPILEEIRRIVRDRHAGGVESIMTDNLKDVRDLKAIFAKLDLRIQSGGTGGEEEISPQSESARSAGGEGTDVGNPITAAERWHSASQATAKTHGTMKEESPRAGSRQSKKAADPNRMSGVWP